MTYQRIIIIGFMGSGKTTVVHNLARKLNRRAVDLDYLIATREGRGAHEIIEQDGEAAFRRVETEALREVLQDETARVIAVGGGAWKIAENRKLIAQSGGLTVWLDVSFALCWKRIEAGRTARPLAPSQDVARRLYAERRPIYESADMRISVSENESAEEIATRIVELVDEQKETESRRQ